MSTLNQESMRILKAAFSDVVGAAKSSIEETETKAIMELINASVEKFAAQVKQNPEKMRPNGDGVLIIINANELKYKEHIIRLISDRNISKEITQIAEDAGLQGCVISHTKTFVTVIIDPLKK